MSSLRFTLLSDDSSDQMLIPVLKWLLQQQGLQQDRRFAWADLRRLPSPPKSLHDRIKTALDLYPCDLLFIHRDAEREALQVRRGEIEVAIQATGSTVQATGSTVPPHVCVIPVRMTEAWLLIDEEALRRAAGNPNGRTPLKLPSITQLENIPNPKDELHRLLKDASELTGRRLRQFNVQERARRLADLIEDFSPLRQLSAFQELENAVSTWKTQYVP
jgi:hypothetical protein